MLCSLVLQYITTASPVRVHALEFYHAFGSALSSLVDALTHTYIIMMLWALKAGIQTFRKRMLYYVKL